ncbi:MAG: hypothetical protein E2P02_25645 [Acidobacteria bacterium]|nr:MAG: hypothetical protein E2P02_25645 [Acidobacteriota bacterium]
MPLLVGTARFARHLYRNRGNGTFPEVTARTVGIVNQGKVIEEGSSKPRIHGFEQLPFSDKARRKK